MGNLVLQGTFFSLGTTQHLLYNNFLNHIHASSSQKKEAMITSVLIVCMHLEYHWGEVCTVSASGPLGWYQYKKRQDGGLLDYIKHYCWNQGPRWGWSCPFRLSILKFKGYIKHYCDWYVVICWSDYFTGGDRCKYYWHSCWAASKWRIWDQKRSCMGYCQYYLSWKPRTYQVSCFAMSTQRVHLKICQLIQLNKLKLKVVKENFQLCNNVMKLTVCSL